MLEAIHIPGVANHPADAISHDRLSILFSQVPVAVQAQSPIPQLYWLYCWIISSTGCWQLGELCLQVVFQRVSFFHSKRIVQAPINF